MVLQYSRSSITEFLSHSQDQGPFHTSSYSEGSLLYSRFKLQIGAGTARTTNTSGWLLNPTSSSSIPDFTRILPELKSFKLNQSSIWFMHCSQQLISWLQKTKAIEVHFACLYMHTNMCMCIFLSSQQVAFSTWRENILQGNQSIELAVPGAI